MPISVHFQACSSFRSLDCKWKMGTEEEEVWKALSHDIWGGGGEHRHHYVKGAAFGRSWGVLGWPELFPPLTTQEGLSP